PALHVGARAEPRPELRSERIIRRHGSPRFLKLNNFQTLLILFSGGPLNAWVPIVKGRGTRARARVPSDALSQPEQRDYGATWKSVRLASTPGTGGTRS